jgi:hypothetical protein
MWQMFLVEGVQKRSAADHDHLQFLLYKKVIKMKKQFPKFDTVLQRPGNKI